MKPDRETLIRALTAALAKREWARAAWLGGSDATGRLDRFSDIDLVTVVDEDRVDDAFAAIKEELESISPVDLEWRVPSPTWHGHEQVFYRLRDADEHLMIDFVVMTRSTPAQNRFLERERHGFPVVLFDHDGFCSPAALDRSVHDQRMRARLERIRVTFPLFQPLVTRAIERGQPCDAAYFYSQLTLAPTVEALRMLHCPERFDFGMRYLFDDLPAEVYTRVCELALPGSLDGIRRCREQAHAMFNDAMERLDHGRRARSER
jgi:predicted nucleotidyltransferase